MNRGTEPTTETRPGVGLTADQMAELDAIDITPLTDRIERDWHNLSPKFIRFTERFDSDKPEEETKAMDEYYEAESYLFLRVLRDVAEELGQDLSDLQEFDQRPAASGR